MPYATTYPDTVVSVSGLHCCHCTFHSSVVLPSIEEHSLVPTKTTLIVVPSHLPNQWEKEVDKFTGNQLKVKVVKNLNHLNKLSIKDIQALDILIVSETLLRTSDEYW